MVLVGCPGPLTVEPGLMLFEVPYEDDKLIIQPRDPIEVSYLDLSSDPIPANFFDPGSEPFSERIDLRGWPLGDSPFCNDFIGNTDTIIEVLQEAQMEEVGKQVQIEAKFVELSLKNVEPIGIPFDGGAHQQMWNVNVGLSPDQPPRGAMALVREQADGGRVSGEIPIGLRATFTRLSDNAIRTLDREDRIVINWVPWHTKTDDLNWSRECTSNVVPGLSKIPILSFFFTRKGVSCEGQHLLILIKATIIEQ